MRTARGPWLAAVAVVATVVASCGGSPAPTTDAPPATPPPTSTPAATAPSTEAPDPAEEAYEAAMCPLFSRIVAIDPRLAAARAGDAGADDLVALRAEVAAIADGLAFVPRWGPGAELADELRESFTAIRAALADEGNAAGLPYITSATIDDAMLEARSAGFFCPGL